VAPPFQTASRLAVRIGALLLVLAALAQHQPSAGESPEAVLAARLAAGEAAAILTESDTALRALVASPATDPKKPPPPPAKLDKTAFSRLAVQRALAQLALAVPDQQSAVAWLAGTRQLGPTLALAIAPKDKAPAVLAVLAALKAKHADRLDEWAGLVTALCVVWDDPAAVGMEKADGAQRALLVFEHHLANQGRLAFDARTLPWQLCAHLADCKVAEDELAWALASYRGQIELARAFFDVPYDKKGLYSGQWQGIKGAPYTLANIKKLGGVCKDQAYFASQVGKALGIPTAFCTGSSGRGEGFHAWLGFLKRTGNVVAIDFNAARYAEHGFWNARITDPQTGDIVSDADIGMLPEWSVATPADRLASAALVAAAELAEPARRDDLYDQAIRWAPANRQAWLGFAAAAAAAGEAEPALRRMQEPLHRFAFGRYDEFAYEMLVRLIRALPLAQAVPIFQRAGSNFAERPDLQARFQVALGDALREQGRIDDALAAYQRVLVALTPRTTPLALEAMDQIDATLRGAGDLKRLAEIYRTTWAKLHVPMPSGYAWTTPWYIVGDHYAKLLIELGRKPEAAPVQKQLDERDTGRERKPEEQTGAKKPGE